MSIAQNFPIVSPALSLDFANVQALDPRINFSRATTATYYGTRTALAEQNLLPYSQTFDNAAWAKGNTTVTANATTAPDGTMTASQLYETSATDVHFIIAPNVGYTGGTTYTQTIYAKAGTATVVQIFATFNNWPTDYANFDLANGVVGNVSGFTAFMTAVGNGWYRIGITTTASTTVGLPIMYLCFTNNSTTATRAPSYAGNSAQYVSIWGAQLEPRSTARAYQVTTTQPVTNYIPVLETAASGVARFDHNPLTFESLGLLIEEQRTNLFTYSEQFDNAFWTKSNASVTINTVVAPDSTLSADKLFENSTLNQHAIFNFSTTVAAGSHTFSVFAKAGERNWIKLGINSTSGVIGAFFNLSTGAVGTVESGVTQTITPVGNNWYRCTVTATASAGASGGANVYLATGNNTLSYTGDGYSGIYIWGAQLEAGAFATSYIPTVASQVTRAADSASMTGTNFTSWFNNAEFSLYQDIQFQAGSPVTLGNSFSNYLNTIINNTFSAQVTGSLGGTAFPTQSYTILGSPSYPVGTFVANQRQVAAFAMSLNSFASGYSGAGATATPTYNPAAATFGGLFFGGTNFAAQNFSGRIRKIAYYPKALTATQIQALTT